MRKIFNITLAVSVESDREIERFTDLLYEISASSPEAKIKILELVDHFEV